MKKKLLSLFMIIALCTAVSTSAAVPEGGFTDVQEGLVSNAVYNAVTWAIDEGITKGYSDGTFRPDNSCTRAEMCIFLWRLCGQEEPDDAALYKQFSDYADIPNATARKAISWAIENGITKGYSDGTFRPQDGCTRAEMCIFLWRVAGQEDPEDTSSYKAFTDYSSNPNATANKAISWAVENGITKGYSDDTFRPASYCKRSEMCIFLQRLCSYMNTSSDSTECTHSNIEQRHFEIPATCTADAIVGDEAYCLDCGEVVSGGSASVSDTALGHAWGDPEWELTYVESTGTYEVTAAFVCSRCGEEVTLDGEVVSVSDDDEVQYMAQVTLDGVTYTEALLYEHDAEPETEPSVEEETDTCTHPGTYTTETVLEEASCTDDGSKTVETYCDECGEKISTETVSIPALGHTWEDPEWEVTYVESTGTNEAKAAFVCSRCGEEVTLDGEIVSVSDDEVQYMAQVTLDGVTYTADLEVVHHDAVTEITSWTFQTYETYSYLVVICYCGDEFANTDELWAHKESIEDVVERITYHGSYRTETRYAYDYDKPVLEVAESEYWAGVYEERGYELLSTEETVITEAYDEYVLAAEA